MKENKSRENIPKDLKGPNQGGVLLNTSPIEYKLLTDVGKMHFSIKRNIITLNKGRFCNNSQIDTLISKRLSVENKAKLSQLETQDTSSAALFIYNTQLREFCFILYR